MRMIIVRHFPAGIELLQMRLTLVNIYRQREFRNIAIINPIAGNTLTARPFAPVTGILAQAVEKSGEIGHLVIEAEEDGQGSPRSEPSYSKEFLDQCFIL